MRTPTAMAVIGRELRDRPPGDSEFTALSLGRQSQDSDSPTAMFAQL